MRLILLLALALLLPGCALNFTTPNGTRISVGFNPTTEQIESLRK